MIIPIKTLQIDSTAEPVTFQLRKWHAIRSSLLITLKFIFSLYCTLFLAVATPFLPHHSVVVYLLGGYISLLFLVKASISWFVSISRASCSVTIDKQKVSLSQDQGGLTLFEGTVYFKLILSDFLFVATPANKGIIPLTSLTATQRNELNSRFLSSDSLIQKSLHFADSLFEIAAIALIIAIHVIYYVAGNFYVPTGSMKDTLIEGDWIIAEKLTYGIRIPQMEGMKAEIRPSFLTFSHPKRGDVIVFRYRSLGEERDYVKRCVAVAGDDFRIKDGGIYVNGTLVDENYTRGLTSYRFFEEGKVDGIVPPGRIVVLGDNREDSRDSREFGYIPVESVIGRVILLYSNFNSIRNFDFFRFGLVR